MKRPVALVFVAVARLEGCDVDGRKDLFAIGSWVARGVGEPAEERRPRETSEGDMMGSEWSERSRTLFIDFVGNNNQNQCVR